MKQQTFDEWFSKAEAYAERVNWPIEKQHEVWREYFKDGYPPDDAVDEDIFYCY